MLTRTKFEKESASLGAPGDVSDTADSTSPIGLREKYTPEEWDIVEMVAQDYGWKYAERYADLALDQARAIGNL